MDTKISVINMEELMDALDSHIASHLSEAEKRIIEAVTPRKIVKGIVKGIAEPLNCSRSYAYTLFESGIFDEATSRHTKEKRGRGKEQALFFDVEKVKEIALRENITARLERMRGM